MDNIIFPEMTFPTHGGKRHDPDFEKNDGGMNFNVDLGTRRNLWLQLGSSIDWRKLPKEESDLLDSELTSKELFEKFHKEMAALQGKRIRVIIEVLD